MTRVWKIYNKNNQIFMSTQEINTLKELFNEKFRGLTTHMNAQFENVNDKLETIEKRLDEVYKDIASDDDRITIIEKNELTHLVTCPQILRVNKIEEDLLEYKMAKKYPKATVFLIVAFVILAGISLFNMKMNLIQAKADTVSTPKTHTEQAK